MSLRCSGQRAVRAAQYALVLLAPSRTPSFSLSHPLALSHTHHPL